MLVVTQAFMKRVMHDWLFGLTTNVKFKLFKNDIYPDAFSVFGDFVQSDFDGYNGNGNFRLFNASQFWNSNGQVEGFYFPNFGASPQTANQTAYGCYVVDTGAGNTILCCGRFTNPIFVVPVPNWFLIMFTSIIFDNLGS